MAARISTPMRPVTATSRPAARGPQQRRTAPAEPRRADGPMPVRTAPSPRRGGNNKIGAPYPMQPGKPEQSGLHPYRRRTLLLYRRTAIARHDRSPVRPPITSGTRLATQGKRRPTPQPWRRRPRRSAGHYANRRRGNGGAMYLPARACQYAQDRGSIIPGGALSSASVQSSP
jgi:hypothetical protein